MSASIFPLSKTKWAICSCCEGNGRMENPVFSQGFTSEEWSELSQDYDDRDGLSQAQRYLRGDFDVPCKECQASGKVRVPDMDKLTFAEKRVLARQRIEERNEAEWRYESAMERAAEARMGC